MPGLVMEAREGEIFTVTSKKDIARQGSPRSPLSPQSPRSDSLDLAMDDVVLDISIEQLYNNVCEMQSSGEEDGDRSPSRNSFFSFGGESRIDSELRHLIGDLGEAEDITTATTIKEIVVEKEEEGDKDAKTKSPNPMPNPKKKKKNKKPLMHRRSVKKSTNKDDPKLPTDGLSLLRRAREMLSSGEDPRRALEIAQRAVSSFEQEEDEEEKKKLDLVMSLHVSAALHCCLGNYSEAISALERSIEAPAIEDGESYALAKFAGCMQLGDTYAAMGQTENSLLLYSAGLEIQRQALGDADPRLGETRRYVAEANVQALNFDEAERICRASLEIRLPEEKDATAADRRLLGLICDAKGDFESALEHYAMASAAMASRSEMNGAEIAAVDRSTGDAYLSLSRYDEAALSYRKSLSAFRSCLGENHPSTASVLVRLADLHNKVGRFRESKSCCEEALRIYESRKKKPNMPGPSLDEEEIAGGLVEVSMIYQSMDELGRAARLLKKASKMFWDGPGRAGIEAQLGVIYYMMGSYKESYEALKSSVSKFRAAAEKKSALFGIALNQMGLACVHLCSINEAAELFEEAKDVLEKEYGPHHPDTLGVYSNLAGTYDAMGRLEDAIETLDYVVGVREEKLGTANPEVADEKRRLGELLKEAGRARNRKPRSLETLLDTKNDVKLDGIEVM